MNTDKLIKILQTQTSTYDQFRIFAYIIREIKTIKGCRFHMHKGNIYITKGLAPTYPCVVAHMDTVHRIVEDLVVIKFGRNLTGFNRATMSQTGIGGDDKVGIYIALECLHLFDHIKLVFFRDEEAGCEGSYVADTSFFDDCNFVLQCDRNGNEDFIVEAAGVQLSSIVFKSAIKSILKKYNYSFAKGMMTDVLALKQKEVDCSMANISCGYYNPHTDQEYVNIDDVKNCLNLVKTIIHELGDTKFPHIFRKPCFLYSAYQPLLDFNFNSHCIDCWSSDVTSTGYCQSCNEYYMFNSDSTEL
jgi:tripeptide aminopeptidase